jgi:hypothetical protein
MATVADLHAAGSSNSVPKPIVPIGRRETEGKDKEAKEDATKEKKEDARSNGSKLEVDEPKPLNPIVNSSAVVTKALQSSEGARELERIEKERFTRIEREAAQNRPSSSVDEWLRDATPSPDDITPLELEDGDAPPSIEQNSAPDLVAPLLPEKNNPADKEKEASRTTRRPLPSAPGNGGSGGGSDAEVFFTGTGTSRDDEARLLRERERQREAREAELKALEIQRIREERELAERRESQVRREAEESAALAQRLKEEQLRISEARAQWQANIEDKGSSKEQAKEPTTPIAIFNQLPVLAEKPKSKRREDDPLQAIFGANAAKSTAGIFDDDDDDDGLSLASIVLAKSAPVSKSPFHADDDDSFDALFGISSNK